LLAEQTKKRAGSEVPPVSQTNPAPDTRHPAPDTVYTGARCIIGDGANIDHTIMWDGVTIEAGATVKRVVIGDGVRIRSDEVIENAAVVRGDLVRNATAPSKALKGEFRGDNFVVSLAQ
jgi:NDP-sugar pyrophosphorylase family protein